VGARTEDRRVILGGLQPGEKVVSNGNFLIDSESRLKSALDDMTKQPAPLAKPAPPAKAASGKSSGTMPPMPGM
jgi:membrane fusion protein, copper/silver efflux system